MTRGDPDVSGLQRALAELGAAGTVEARGRLAVLTALDVAALAASPQARARALALAAEHGFTHLAVEIAT